MKRKYYLKQAKRNSPIFILLFGLLTFNGCSKEKIPEETLVKVYVENVIVEETYSLNADSLRIHKKAVFDRYKISENDFREELTRYSDDKTKWESFFKQANVYLNDLKKSNAIQ